MPKEKLTVEAIQEIQQRLHDCNWTPEEIARFVGQQLTPYVDYEKVEVTLFKPSGKYYTTEQWRIPEGAIGPYDMDKSPDFRRIGENGPVLIDSQEPWGYPHLFP